MAKRPGKVVASVYDTSKGLSRLTEADKAMMMSSKKASRVEEEVSEEEEDDDKQKSFGKRRISVEAVPEKNISLDEYQENSYQMQPLVFPTSKKDGAELCLERLDYMTRQVERLRRQSSHPSTPGERFGGGDSDLEAQEKDMEKALFDCCQPRRADFRLLELLGPQGQNVLQLGQLNVVEYFRYKYAMLGSKSDFSRPATKDPVASAHNDEPSSPSDIQKLPEGDMVIDDPLKGLIAQSSEGLRVPEESPLDGYIGRRGSLEQGQGQGHGRRRLPPPLDLDEESSTHPGSQLSTQASQKTRAPTSQNHQSSSVKIQDGDACLPSSAEAELPKDRRKSIAPPKSGKKEQHPPRKGSGSKTAKKRDGELPPLPLKK